MRIAPVRIVPLLLLLLAAPALAAPAKSKSAGETVKPVPAPAKSAALTPGAVDDGWPEGAAGTLGWKWVRAFNAGPEAMRKFYDEDLAEASRRERSLDFRISRYRELRERMGTLTLLRIVSREADVVHAQLLDADQKPHVFVFTAEAVKPFRLVSVGVMQHAPGGHP